MALRITGGLGCVNKRAFEYRRENHLPFYLPVHSLKNRTPQVCDEKPHDHVATTLAKRNMTGLSKSPDSPELVANQRAILTESRLYVHLSKDRSE